MFGLPESNAATLERKVLRVVESIPAATLDVRQCLVDENAANHYFELVLVGHLTVASLESALAEQLAELPAPGSAQLLVDCSALEDYDVDARARFTKWVGSERHRFSAIAIVTDNQLYHLVIAAMALASRMNMKAFDGRSAAERWLAADHARRLRRSHGAS